MKDRHLVVLIAGCLVVAVLAAFAGGNAVALLIGVALGATCSALLAWRFLLRPMRNVADAASEIAAGDYGARAESRPAGPAAALSGAFNRMAESVQYQMGAASQERNRLAAAMNSSVDAVAALDSGGRVLFANIGFEQTVGRDRDEITGQPLVYVLPDEQVLDAVRASRDRGERKVVLVERPGRRFLQVVTTPIAGGGEWSVLVVCHDISDVKRTELVRRDFVANVSHELRTPLAAIKSVVETLADGALNDEAVAQEFLRRADQEVDRLVLMVEELLELSRIESGEQPLLRGDTDIDALIGDVLRRMQSQAERAQVALRLDVAVPLGTINLDGTRIERAVINLTQNALKFTPPGGSVTLSARREDNNLIVEVRDTGVGIDARDLPRVFERFYKVDPSRTSTGSGLGLALVKHAVEAHGGSVAVRSQPGDGSVFTLSVPIVAATPVDTP